MLGAGTTGSPWGPSIRCWSSAELASDAGGIGGEQDGNAVAGPLSDLGGWDAAVEPRGQAGLAQVVDVLARR